MLNSIAFNNNANLSKERVCLFPVEFMEIFLIDYGWEFNAGRILGS